MFIVIYINGSVYIRNSPNWIDFCVYKTSTINSCNRADLFSYQSHVNKSTIFVS